MPNRKALPSLSIQLLSAAAAALLLACSSGEGGPCQENSDCESGLVCNIAPSAERGTCERPENINREEDASVDGGPEPVLPEEDAGFEEPDAATDSGVVDAEVAAMEDAGG
jgi:hypothetical protein